MHGMTWDEIEAAVDAGDLGRALERALGAWRARRHAVIADLVDVLGAKTAGDPVTANGATAFQAAWVARAKDAPAGRIGALLGGLTRSIPMPHEYFWEEGSAPRRFAAWFERLEALAALPDDPRIAAALFDVVRRAPWSSYYLVDTAAAYDPALRLIERTADERLLPAMRDLLETPTASRQLTRRHLSAALPAVIGALEDAQRRQRALEPEERERCERIIERLGGRVGTGRPEPRAHATHEDEAALLELVVASPEDDDPREVLADFWLERQDPRGELVMLQLKMSRGAATASDEKAIRALLREHERTWLDDVALVTKKRVFRRGFLDEIELVQNAAADPKVWESAALDPRLATVRTVRKGKANEAHYRRFLFSPAMRSLRDLTVVSKGMLKDVCERPEPWPIEHLDLAFMPDKKAFAAIASSRSLPALARVTAGVTQGNVDKLLALAASFASERPIERIAAAPVRWYNELAPLASWLIAAQTTLAHVPIVEIDFSTIDENRIVARRGNTGLRLELVCAHMYFMSALLPLLRDVEHVRVRVPDGGEARFYDLDEARRLLAAYPSDVVDLDAGWTAALRAPSSPRHRDA